MSIKTVSLETAKALKEAGFIFYKNTSFLWVDLKGLWVCWYWKEFDIHCHMELKDNSNYKIPEAYCAPTTDELLEELPFSVDGDKLRLIRGANTRVWHVWYGDPKAAFMHSSLPEALAQMWLWLHKENLL